MHGMSLKREIDSGDVFGVGGDDNMREQTEVGRWRQSMRDMTRIKRYMGVMWKPSPVETL